MSKQKYTTRKKISVENICSDREETTILIKRDCCELVGKEYKTSHVRVGTVIHWELWKKLKFDEPIVYAKTGEWDAQSSLKLWNTNECSNFDQTKKWIYRILDFAVPSDHREKLNEEEKKYIYS